MEVCVNITMFSASPDEILLICSLQFKCMSMLIPISLVDPTLEKGDTIYEYF